MIGKFCILTLLLCNTALSQTQPAVPAIPPSSSAPAKPLAFDVISIRPNDPKTGGMVGFLSFPGGRVDVGFATVKMLLYFAFDVQEFQIVGGPTWIATDRYEIEAEPPDYSAPRTANQVPMAATPTQEQRQMLQSLLADRFGLKYHRGTQEGTVYILSLGKEKPRLDQPKNPDWDPRGSVQADGSARFNNVTMKFFARELSFDLGTPVLDQTGLTGSYDFELPATDSSNPNITVAALDTVQRLGLQLKKTKAPVETLVIDHIEPPSPN